MPLTLDAANVVVLGAWNPAIISPAWLGRNGVIEHVPDHVQMGFHALGRRFAFPLGGFDWEVDDSKLVVSSKHGEDCGQCVASVLRLLPHTPTHAMGTNFVFHCPLQEWPEALVPRLGDIGLPKPNKTGSLAEVKFTKAQMLNKKTQLQTTVSATAAGNVVVSFNLHRNVQNAKEARRAAQRWPRDQQTVASLLKRMFGEEFVWAE